MSNAIGPDVSFYQDDNDTPQKIDFSKMRGVSKYVIIRAGQRNWPDEDFVYNWKSAKEADLLRGSYWFYDDRDPPENQAWLWLDLLGNDPGELPLFLDIEKKYGGPYWGAQHWKKFLDEIARLTNHEHGIYTAYYVWKDNTTEADRQYFSKYPLWVANYGASSPLIPLGWTDWLFWQFTDKGDGSIYGVESSNIDLNYFNGTESELINKYGNGEPPPEPQPGEWLFKIKPEHIVRAEVTGYSSNKTVAYAAEEFQKTVQPGNRSIVINGDGWRTSGISNGDWVVGGVWKHVQPKDTYMPRITFDVNNKGAIAGARGEYWYPEQVQDHNAFGLTRRLVKNGAINPAFVDPGELNSRTAFGFTPDGTLVIYVCDGWDRSVTGEPPKGKTIKQTGEILIENGCIEGGDGDGGGSVTLAIDGVVINDYNYDGQKVMRPVVNHLCLEIIGEAMPDFPFLASVKIGASVYSPDGARPWGSVSDAMPQPMTVVGSVGDKYKISNPLWSNGKEWTTPTTNVTEYVEPEPPPTDPPTDPGGDVPFTITIGDDVTYYKQVITGTAKKI